MKKSFQLFCILCLLYSCNGGNMNEGVRAGPDTVDVFSDSGNEISKPKIDTPAPMQATDTALYKRNADTVKVKY